MIANIGQSIRSWPTLLTTLFHGVRRVATSHLSRPV